MPPRGSECFQTPEKKCIITGKGSHRAEWHRGLSDQTLPISPAFSLMGPPRTSSECSHLRWLSLSSLGPLHMLPFC